MTNETIASAFDGARLKQARELSMMTKKALAEKLAVSPTAISQFESGATKPRPDLIPTISSHLGFPREFFATGRPLTSLDISETYFRSLRSTPVKQLNKATAYVSQCWELVNLLENYVVLPEVDLPEFDIDPGVPAEVLDPSAAALETRRLWNLGLQPVPHLVRQLEARGIVVLLAPETDPDLEKVDAYSTSALSRPIIMLTNNRSDDLYRFRFSAAHELGHIILHSEKPSGSARIEREADSFAGEFLAPSSVLKDLLPRRIDLSAYSKLSTQWGISIKSLIYRAKALGIISDSTARRAYISLAEHQKNGILTSPRIGQFPGEVPSLLKSAAKIAFEEEGVNNTAISKKLAWPKSAVEALIEDQDRRPRLRLVDSNFDSA